MLSDISHAQRDIECYDKYENLLSQELWSNDGCEKLSVSPKSIRSQLRAEYALSLEDQDSPDIQKPDLYILGGFSGCGKTTLLNSTSFSIDKIFSQKEVCIGMLPSELSERIAKRRSLTSNFLQSMLFCNAFCIHDIPYMRMQNILPKKCLLHLDLSNVLLNPRLKELVGVDCLKWKT